jgi:hypothetical protein
VAALLPQYAEPVRAGLAAGWEREAIAEALTQWEEGRLHAEGVPEALWPGYGTLAPASMSADGMLRYWQKHGTA